MTSCGAPGADVGNAEAVPQDVDRRVEAAQPQPSGGLGQRPPEELVPEAGAGPDRGEHGRRTDRGLGHARVHRSDSARLSSTAEICSGLSALARVFAVTPRNA